MILEVCWDSLWTLSFGLSQFHGHGYGSCVKRPVDDVGVINAIVNHWKMIRYIIGYISVLLAQLGLWLSCDIYEGVNVPSICLHQYFHLDDIMYSSQWMIQSCALLGLLLTWLKYPSLIWLLYLGQRTYTWVVYVVRCGSKNGYQKDMCLEEKEPQTPNMVINNVGL